MAFTKNVGKYMIKYNKVLGKGKFSIVYEGYLVDNKEFRVAVKEIEISP